jgi:formamidopyrimidine-DNA glycosylase
MPELPEVETVANGVNARVRAERIVGAWFSDKREPMKTPPAVMEQVLTGAVVQRVHRVGKTVVFDLLRENGEPAQWLVHLGMTGRLLVNEAEVEKPKHTHAVLSLASGRELRFVDPRRFGRLGIFGMEGPDVGRGGGRGDKKQAPRTRHQAPASGVSSVEAGALRPLKKSEKEGGFRSGTVAAKTPGLKPVSRTKKLVGLEPHASTETPGTTFAGTGAEPLTIAMDDFAALFRGRETPIKAALLNQKLLHGVGNIYADEALFRAGVRPMRKAARVTRSEMERLRVGLVEVLRQAIALGGSSVSDYVDAEGSRGFFQLEHRVYQRTGEPCLVCGMPIRKKVIGGRSSHFCPVCQK